jgi:hypothetical protein
MEFTGGDLHDGVDADLNGERRNWSYSRLALDRSSCRQHLFVGGDRRVNPVAASVRNPRRVAAQELRRMTVRLIACALLVALLDQRMSMAQQPPPRRGRGIGAIAGRYQPPQPQVRSCDEARSTVGSLSFAPPTRIDFDDVGKGDLTNQYASRGVTFNSPTPLDFSQALGISAFAHSPTQGIQQCYGKEFCTAPIEMSFAEPQARVQVWVGYAGRVQTPDAIWLEIIDVSGRTIDHCGVTITQERTPQPIALPLELTTASNAITIARVSAPTLGIAGVAVDDLEFQRIAPRFPDLVIGNINANAPPGERARIRIVVFVRDAPSPATTLTVESPAWGTLSADVRALDPQEEGEGIEVPLPVDLRAGIHEFVVRLASPPGAVESNLDNNVKAGRIDVPANNSQSSASPGPAANPPAPQPPPRRRNGGSRTNLVPWLIGGVLALAAVGFVIGRLRKPTPRIPLPKQKTCQPAPRRLDNQPRPQAQPPRGGIDVEPKLDTGLQKIAPARARPAFVLRVRSVMGPSSIHVTPGSLRS